MLHKGDRMGWGKSVIAAVILILITGSVTQLAWQTPWWSPWLIAIGILMIIAGVFVVFFMSSIDPWVQRRKEKKQVEHMKCTVVDAERKESEDTK